MTTLNFSVDGSFITDLLRTWYWEEHRPLDVCENLIKTCCSDIEESLQTDILCTILEGRKKLIGVNTFTLVDDNEHIRPLINKLKDEERRNILGRIKLDMTGNFRKYVDKYATIKSSHIDALFFHGMPNTFQECREYFTMDKNHDTGEFQEIDINGIPLIDTPTMGGLWLIHAPDTVYEACHGDMNLIGKPEFWQNIYELTKDNPDFADRNERYKFSIQQPDTEKHIRNLIKSYEKKHPTSEEPEPEFMSPEWMKYQYQSTKELTYLTEPDNIERWEGLIAPNGDFYSVEFGGHNQKAYHILVMHADWFNQTPDYFLLHPTIRVDNALDTLLEYGWCATRSVMFDQYVLPPLPQKPTKQQCNRIFDAITKHDVHINIEELMSYFE